MNKLYILILIIITFIGCDGRHRAHMSNEAVLREANLFQSFSEELKYIPEQPTEIVTDTLLSNGFHIKTTYHTIENSFVSKKANNKNETTTNTYHHNFEVQFQIHKSNFLIREGIINKQLFYKKDTHAFWQNAIMQFVWVDYEAMTEHSIQLNTSFNMPGTHTFKDYTITFYDDGQVVIKEINITNSSV